MASMPTLSVSQLIASVNQTLEYAYPSLIVEGEVASFKVNQGKYVFFDLKDASGSVNCFMSLWNLRMPIEDGMKVLVVATPKLTAWGKFSLTIQSIKPSGEGSLKKSFELLKAKLAGEGLFDADRKRALPVVPKHIAVISSTGAAGYADFMKILNDRFGGIKVDVASTLVQGADAPDQIIRAIEYFNQQPELAEVLVIIRGGGGADDLSAFNDEKLVRAIAASRIPTLVGVGHEVDTSLADLAADVRAATPSNAAQIIVPDRRELISSVKQRVITCSRSLENEISRHQNNVNYVREQLASKMERQVDLQVNQLVNVRRVLAELNPYKVLERGYALIRAQSGLAEIAPGQNLEVETKDMIIKAEVTDVREK